jgi:hypothetical protein
MIRRGTGYLIAAGLTSVSLASAISACSDSIKAGGPSGSTGGSTSSAGGSTSTGNTGNTNTGNTGNTTSGGGSTGSPTAAVPDDTKCSAECCPTDAACYSSSAAQSAPGAACLATRDNTNQNHVQFRQSWIRATAPKGNVGGIVYAVLSGRTELPLSSMMGTGLPNCNMNGGTIGYGGYMQLSDLYFKNGMQGSMPDYDNDYGMTGFSVYVSKMNVLDDLKNGFCYGTEDWLPSMANQKYALGPSDMSPMTDFAGGMWPPGLPAPMPLKDASGKLTAWHVTPSKAFRRMTDFDLSTKDRTDIIADLDPKTGAHGMKGFSGVFFYDASTGYQHSYGPLGWVIVYNADGSTHIAIPARETEIKSTVNDPTHPNCMGEYGVVQDPATGMPTVTKANGCTNTTDGTPPWGGGNCTASTGMKTCKAGEGPFSTKLYFLISELEQIYSDDLMSTLCVSYPTADPLKPDFYNDADHSCIGPKWNPSSADGSGLPKGDWCAATNSAATDKCHDAWRSTNFHTFSGANIKLDSMGNPATCAF